MIVISPTCTIYGVTVAPGSFDDQSAYRSELTGIYGIAMTIRHLEKHYHFKGEVTIGCDGLSALYKASHDIDFSNPNEPQYDLITAIRQTRQASSSTWQWRHIRLESFLIADVSSMVTRSNSVFEWPVLYSFP
jgi:hypothetical protein